MDVKKVQEKFIEYVANTTPSDCYDVDDGEISVHDGEPMFDVEKVVYEEGYDIVVRVRMYYIIDEYDEDKLIEWVKEFSSQITGSSVANVDRTTLRDNGADYDIEVVAKIPCADVILV